MSNTKTFLTLALLVLLGSMGAAQAQNFAEIKLFTTRSPSHVRGVKTRRPVASSSILLTRRLSGRKVQ